MAWRKGAQIILRRAVFNLQGRTGYMKHKLLIALLSIGLLPSFLFAQHYKIDIDLQDPGKEWVIDRVFTGNTIGLDAKFYDGTTPYVVTNWTMYFRYGRGQYDTNGMVPIRGVASGNQVIFESVTNLFFSPSENYYFSISGVDGAGRKRTFARGRMIEEYDPSTAGSGGVLSNGFYYVGWGNIFGDVTNNQSLVEYIAGGVTVTNATDAQARATGALALATATFASNLAASASATGTSAYALAYAASTTGTAAYALAVTKVSTNDARYLAALTNAAAFATAAQGAKADTALQAESDPLWTANSNAFVKTQTGFWLLSEENGVRFLQSDDGYGVDFSNGEFSSPAGYPWTFTGEHVGNAASLTGFPLSVWANGINYPASQSNTFDLGTIGGATNGGWTNLAFSGSGNAITGATADATTLTLQRGTIDGGGGTTVLTNASGERGTIWLAATSTTPTISPTNYSWGYAPSVSNTLTVAAKSDVTNHATVRLRCHIPTGVTCSASGFAWPVGIVPPFIGDLEFVSLPSSTNWSCRIAERRVAGVPSAYDDAVSVWWPSRTGSTLDMMGRNPAQYASNVSISAYGFGLTNNSYSVVSYGQRSGDASLEPNTANYTAAAWINPTNLADKLIMGRGFANSGVRWWLAINATSFYAMVVHQTPNAAVYATNPIPTQTWSHVALTITHGEGLRLYLNGACVATNLCMTSAGVALDQAPFAYNYLNNTWATPFAIGNYFNSGHIPESAFQGNIDAAAVARRAWGADEILRVFEIGRTP